MIKEGDKSEAQLPSFINLSFEQTLNMMIDSINLFCNRDNQVWVLAFDELEIAPKSIREKLITLLRSTNSNIIFKLAMSPYAHDFDLLGSPTSPSAINDYVPISLWYSTKEEARPFCLAFFDSICKAYEISDVKPISIFGPSEFDAGRLEQSKKTSYVKGSQHHARFVSLSKRDQSFRAYLNRKSIDINKLDLMSEDERASKVRKITNIVSQP